MNEIQGYRQGYSKALGNTDAPPLKLMQIAIKGMKQGCTLL
jgi:hypothetical protein